MRSTWQSFWRTQYDQFKALLPTLALIYMPVIGALALAGIQTAVPVEYLMYDPAEIVGESPYIGLFSNIGVLGWCVAATVCLFSALALRGSPAHRQIRPFLLISGLITAVLLFDDFFALHQHTHLIGIPNRVVFTVYLAVVFVHLLAFRRLIAQTEYLILILALAFFVSSTVLDYIQHRLPELSFEAEVLFEEGLKLLGIVSWLLYFARTSLSQFRAAIPLAHQEGER